MYGIKQLESGVEVVCIFEIVDADDAGSVLFAVDVVVGCELVEFLQVLVRVGGTQVELYIGEGV